MKILPYRQGKQTDTRLLFLLFVCVCSDTHFHQHWQLSKGNQWEMSTLSRIHWSLFRKWLSLSRNNYQSACLMSNLSKNQNWNSNILEAKVEWACIQISTRGLVLIVLYVSQKDPYRQSNRFFFQMAYSMSLSLYKPWRSFAQVFSILNKTELY